MPPSCAVSQWACSLSLLRSSWSSAASWHPVVAARTGSARGRPDRVAPGPWGGRGEGAGGDADARDSGTVRVLFVHHDANSGDGHVGRAFDGMGAEVVTHQVCAEPSSPVGSPVFPDLVEPVAGGDGAAFDRIVVFGSRWSVDDPQVAHWVEPEIRFLQRAVADGVPILGLCFGAQILATALGGTVGRTEHPEIGWFDVDVNDVGAVAGIESGPWLQWHFDAFTVPPGATELARSRAGPQAFALGPHLGLQYHPEADRSVLEGWMVDDLDQLVDVGLDADVLLAGADEHFDAAAARARRLVRRFCVQPVRRG